MKVFDTDMELATFIFLILEVVMFISQFLLYLQRPKERRRLYYLLLLALFIFYNVFGGLFPDPSLKAVPLHIQNLLAWGSGFLLACFMPFYIYKAFDLQKLRFHALYGVWLFLIAPFVVCFGIEYAISGNIDRVVKHAVIIPFIYAIICANAVYRSIKQEKLKDNKSNKEMYLNLAAIAPWLAMPILSYFRISQLPEVLVMNGGFLIITGLFIWEAVKQSREEVKQLETCLAGNKENGYSECIAENSKRFNLSPREIDVAKLVAIGLKYREIADKLFIQERTVTTHIQKIFVKTGARNKVELINILKS
ncbi:LuxR family transcriptional regulator [bacterium]|nr:MAG: LuxR family transcriptional regulator [bacterium]